MGRYYEGDINGKFWFGIQDSNDPDFFGKKGFVSEVGWSYSEEDIPKVQEGIDKCKLELDTVNRDFLKAFNHFFSEKNGYNDDMLLEYFNYGVDKNVENVEKYTIKEIRDKLVWYARLQLGEQILEGIKEHQNIYFYTSDL